MSYNLVDPTTGDLTPVAGRGRAEYGASTIRKGTVVLEPLPASSPRAVNIVFDTPMPNSDYEVMVTVKGANAWTIQATPVTPFAATGFTVSVFNSYPAEISDISLEYVAFKLYSDVEYSNIVNSMPSNASASNKLATASDIPNITPLAQSVAAIEGKIPSNASTSNKMATASDITGISTNATAIENINEKIPSGASASNQLALQSSVSGVSERVTAIENAVPSGASSSDKFALQSSITSINSKIPSNASASNKMATASDIPNITPLEQSIQTLSSTKLQAGGGIIPISNQFQWLKPEANAIRYTNNTGRPILVTGLFIQGVTAYTTNMKDDGTVIAAFSNLTGRIDFTFTLTAVVKAGGVLAVYNDKPEGDAALLCSLSAQVL